jgi:hypothetical protein
MQAVRAFDDRTRKLDNTAIVTGRWREGHRTPERDRGPLG